MTISKGLKVMLADDDQDDRELFEEAINTDSTLVQTFIDGEMLMNILQSEDTLPDCVFIDLNMPQKSGQQCLQEIRQHDKLKNLPVVMYSTSSNRRDIDETFALGANLYVVKPSSFKSLRATLNSVVTLDWNLYQPNQEVGNFVYTVS